MRAYSCPKCDLVLPNAAHRRECRPPQSEEPPTFPQAGDTVVITLTPAEVVLATAGWIRLAAGSTLIRRQDIASIEKVPDPLPTTPGSAIYIAGGGIGFAMTLWRNGQWGFDRGEYTYDALCTSYGRSRITVLVDAGKATP